MQMFGMIMNDKLCPEKHQKLNIISFQGNIELHSLQEGKTEEDAIEYF